MLFRSTGGIFRYSQGLSKENIETLAPFMKKEYTHHSDKSVRKASVKLVKDVLKGSISMYPRGIRPFMQNKNTTSNTTEKKNVLGAPNTSENCECSWYIPDSNALSAGAFILRNTAVKTMCDVKDTLAELAVVRVSEGGVSSETLSFKKTEESIAYGLKLLQKCLRGAAEMLGDDHMSTKMVDFPVRKITSTKSDDEVDGMVMVVDGGPVEVEKVDELEGLLIIRSAAQTLLTSSTLSQEDRDLFVSLRFTVLRFLVFVNDSLKALNVTSVVTGVSNGSGSTFSGLYDSAIIQVTNTDTETDTDIP